MSQALEAYSREQLRDLAKLRGITLPQHAKKADLVKALQKTPPAEGERDLESRKGGKPAPKHDLRPDAPAPAPHDLPWGYGDTRITALARDPYWLYAYWEVTDEAITTARGKLGPGGDSAFFTLRVYDTTCRLFDGTNANSYFDVPVDRAWNSYFIKVDRPRCVFHIEAGMKSHEGYFAAITRSGAAEMPSDAVSGNTHAGWMTVIPNQSAPRPPPYKHRHTPRPHPVSFPQPPPPQAESGGPGPSQSWGSMQVSGGSWDANSGRILSFLLGGEATYGQWFEQILGGRFVRFIRWQTTGQRTFWQSGPQRVSWEHVGPVEIWFEGQRRALFGGGGGTGELGPWHVVISGIGAHGEHRILDTWMVRMAWGSAGVLKSTDSPALYRRIYGAYGRRDIFTGASEVLVREEVGASQELLAGASQGIWLAASEMMMGGASEIAALGASELLARGASESFWMGASENVWGGASLYAAMGASEQQLGGGSEILLGGSSLFAGASERELGGASKAAFGGATENLFQGGSERTFQGGSESIVGVSSGDSWQGFAVVPMLPGPGSAPGSAARAPVATPVKNPKLVHFGGKEGGGAGTRRGNGGASAGGRGSGRSSSPKPPAGHDKGGARAHEAGAAGSQQKSKAAVIEVKASKATAQPKASTAEVKSATAAAKARAEEALTEAKASAAAAQQRVQAAVKKARAKAGETEAPSATAASKSKRSTAESADKKASSSDKTPRASTTRGAKKPGTTRS